VRSYLRLLQELWRSNRLIKSKAFTLVEVLVVTFISVIIFSAIFMVLNMGEFQNRIGSTRIDVQQEARRALDWMMRDMRQTHRTFMNVTNETGYLVWFVDVPNGQAFSDPELQLCTGYDVATGETSWTPYTIRYEFNATSQTVTRTDSNTAQVLRFNNITDLTFTCIDHLNLLRVNITAQKVAKSSPAGNITQVFNLSEEVRLRND